MAGNAFRKRVRFDVVYRSKYGRMLLNPGRRLLVKSGAGQIRCWSNPVLVKSGIRGSCGADASPWGAERTPRTGQTMVKSDAGQIRSGRSPTPCTGQTMAQAVYWSNKGFKPVYWSSSGFRPVYWSNEGCAHRTNALVKCGLFASSPGAGQMYWLLEWPSLLLLAPQKERPGGPA